MWLLPILLLSQMVDDPIGDYIENPIKWDGFEHQLVKLEVVSGDVDGDGNDEVLVRSVGDYAYRGDRAWQVYRFVEGEYARWDTIDLTVGHIFFGTIPRTKVFTGYIQLDKKSLITYLPVGSNLGTVVGFHVVDDRIESFPIGKIDASISDANFFQEVFPEGSTPIRRVNVAEYVASHARPKNAESEDTVLAADSPVSEVVDSGADTEVVEVAAAEATVQAKAASREIGSEPDSAPNGFPKYFLVIAALALVFLAYVVRRSRRG